MEFVALNCLHLKQYDELFRMFGFDKTKLTFEVEKFLGRKIARPQAEQSTQATPALPQQK